MPEICEVRGFAQVVQTHSGPYSSVLKCEGHRCEDIRPLFTPFLCSAKARGKEMMLSIIEVNGDGRMYLRFLFGLTGSFQFIPPNEDILKHSHLIFTDENGGRLCFVDPRRFGSWQVVKSDEEWSKDRSPDLLSEFDAFALNLAKRFETKKHTRFFTKPICEVLLDQTLFNGIGNYLRAEILNHSLIHPFTPTNTVFADLTIENCISHPFLLSCKTVSERFLVVDYEKIKEITTTYGQKSSQKCKDRTGRTIWWVEENVSMKGKARKGKTKKEKTEKDLDYIEERKGKGKGRGRGKGKGKKMKEEEVEQEESGEEGEEGEGEEEEEEEEIEEEKENEFVIKKKEGQRGGRGQRRRGRGRGRGRGREKEREIEESVDSSPLLSILFSPQTNEVRDEKITISPISSPNRTVHSDLNENVNTLLDTNTNTNTNTNINTNINANSNKEITKKRRHSTESSIKLSRRRKKKESEDDSW
jgi:formamidopyrimidine-DNA glycosylase